jgi:acetyltransferase-like isoleucine patch superfamily enzyme
MLKIIIRFRKLLVYLFVGRKFLDFHVTSKIICPISISSQFIKIGKCFQIYHHCRIHGIQKSNQNKPVIHTGNNVSIQQNMHLILVEAISIGSNTAMPQCYNYGY